MGLGFSPLIGHYIIMALGRCKICTVHYRWSYLLFLSCVPSSPVRSLATHATDTSLFISSDRMIIRINVTSTLAKDVYDYGAACNVFSMLYSCFLVFLIAVQVDHCNVSRPYYQRLVDVQLFATRVNSSYTEKIVQSRCKFVTDPWDRQACDEMRLSVEFVTVGFLGICRQYCCDWFPVSWRADELRLKGVLR